MKFEMRFQHELLKAHLEAMNEDDLLVLRAAQETGDVDLLLNWYFGDEDRKGISLLPAVKPMFYAPHPNQFWLGSYASGKTLNMAAMAFIHCLTKSFFKFVNLGPIGRQAELMFDKLRVLLVNNKRVEHLVTKVTEAPGHHLIRLWNESSLEFLTAKPEYLDYIKGEEFDDANLDEGALLPDFGRVVGIIRPRLRGVRPRTGIERLGLLTVTTVPGDDEELKARYERGLGNDPDYISIKLLARHNPFVTEDQIRLMLQDIPAEDIPIYMDCEWPEAVGRLIPETHYSACEDVDLDILLDSLIQKGELGASKTEFPRLGVTRWELPYREGHTYITVGDPGTMNPPKRGAGAVMSWDITTEPAQMVYFDWVFGNGSITPWIASFRYAVDKYPGNKAFDSTGDQKNMDELVWEKEGLIVYPINFSRDKPGLLNSLRIALERRAMTFPVIPGMRSQALRYTLPDKKIAQDLVATLMMGAWMIRPTMVQGEPEQEGLPYLWAPRGYREGRTIRRGR